MAIWTKHGDGRTVAPGAVVKPNERLNVPISIAIGMQHVVAMFGATFTVPLVTGFPVSTTLLFSGIGTLVFLLITQNRLPSYLGSSFAFLAPIMAVAGGNKLETPEQFGIALVGVIVAGALLAIVGFIVQAVGSAWIDKLMPPVVAGAIVALIGFNLAPLTWQTVQLQPIVALVTLVSIVFFAVFFRGFIGRISIFLGVVVGYITAFLMGDVSFEDVEKADWVGLPQFHLPDFTSTQAWMIVPMFLPVVLVLIAENVGHVRGVAIMTDDSVNKQTGRALIADGVATMIAGSGGGSATTTYGENIGVMAATRVYSTFIYWIAGIFAILLAFSPKIGAVFYTIPDGVLGGATTALYGLIGVIGIKIWVDNRVDFSRPVNQFTVAISFVIAIAGFTWVLPSGLEFGAIVIATVAALVIYHGGNLIARWRRTGADDGGPIPAVGQLGGDPED